VGSSEGERGVNKNKDSSAKGKATQLSSWGKKRLRGRRRFWKIGEENQRVRGLTGVGWKISFICSVAGGIQGSLKRKKNRKAYARKGGRVIGERQTFQFDRGEKGEPGKGGSRRRGRWGRFQGK